MTVNKIRFVKSILLFSGVFVISLFFCFLLPNNAVYADTYSFTANETWGGTCSDQIYINGQASENVYYNNGSTIALNVENSSPQTLAIGIKGNSPQYVSSGHSALLNINLSGQMAVAIWPQACGGYNSSNLYIYGATGSASCSTAGRIWNVGANFDSVAPVISIYKGNVYVARMFSSGGTSGAGNVDNSVEFAAESSPATYYVYDGSSSSAAPIGQATCTAVAVATSTTPGQSGTNSSPQSISNTSQPTSASSTSPASTTPSTASINYSSPAYGTVNKNVDLYKNAKFDAAWVVALIVVALWLITVLSSWRTVKRANRPSWTSLAPIYNVMLLLKLRGNNRSLAQQPAVPMPQDSNIFTSGEQYPGNTVKSSRNKRVYLYLAVILVVIIGLTAIFLELKHHQSTQKSASSLNCTPPAGNTATKALAIKDFKQVVAAIKAQDLQCVNALSSSFFVSYQKVVAAQANGNWITYSPGGVGSVVKAVSTLLPASLNDSSFIAASYTRPEVANPNGSGLASYYQPASGLKLSYPETKSTSASYVPGFYFNLAFVSQNNKILLDNFLEGPTNSAL